MGDTRFITFEGGEGGGKSTQLKLLASVLEQAGTPVVVTREPGGSPASEEIRSLLVSGTVDRWLPVSEALLNVAARAEHVHRTIKPALDAGKWVISDRFADSTLAYQGYGHGLELSDLRALHRIALGDFYPDLTIILDIAVEDGLARAGARKDSEDRYERMATDFHQRLRDGFLKIAANQPDRCRVVDASQSVANVHRQITGVVNAVFGLKLPC